MKKSLTESTKTHDYDNPWTFSGQPFYSEDIEKYVGFVYIIVEVDTQRFYLGRKYFHQLRKTKGKSKRVRSESDWKKYYGSSKGLLQEIKKNGIGNYKRIILSLHTTKGDVNYEEVKQQFKRDVLERDDYYNDNINGKWYKKPLHISESRAYSRHDNII